MTQICICSRKSVIEWTDGPTFFRADFFYCGTNQGISQVKFLDLFFLSVPIRPTLSCPGP